MVLAMAGPEEQREFKFGWSLFRRAHQAIARRCHKKGHEAKHAGRHAAPREPDPAPSGTMPASPTEPVLRKRAAFSPTPSSSASESYCRSRSRGMDARGATTDRCSAQYCG
jgi:hypothetical protein